MRTEPSWEQDLVLGEASGRGRSGAARPAGNSQRDERVTGLEPAEGTWGRGVGVRTPRSGLSVLHPDSSGPTGFRLGQRSAHTQPGSAGFILGRDAQRLLVEHPPCPDGETEALRGRVVSRFSE